MLAAVVPQSSCSFRPAAPASTCSCSGSGRAEFPFPRKPKLSGKVSIAWSIRCRFQAPGVQVVALVPVAGPVPPPSMVVTPEVIDSSACWGEMKWMWASMPPGVVIIPSPAMISVDGPISSVTPSIVSGLPALPTPAMRPSLTPISAFVIPQWSRMRALVMTRSIAPSSRVATPWAIPSRMDFPPPKTASSPASVRSCSTSTNNSVSANRNRSPTVGPNMPP